MQISNEKHASTIRIVYMAVPSVFIIATALIYFLTKYKKLQLALIVGGILILFFGVMSIFQFLYINFYAAPDKIRLRYKSLSPIPTQKNSILIKSEDFYDYKLTKKILGIKTSLQLFTKTPGGIATFSKVSLISLKPDEIEKIKKSLDLILLMNKNKTAK